MSEVKVNRQYKDRLFRRVFSDKEDLLALYNAVNGSSYEDPEALEITTIEDVLYVGMKNDVSFLIGDVLNLYEHQSTRNPNMTVRGLFYFSDLFRKWIDRERLNLYGRRRIPLPTPKYIIFYNGQENAEERMELKLSDSFTQPGACLELTATMLNINFGHNRDIMEKCHRLSEYAEFVSRVRESILEGKRLEEAMENAVASCISDGILSEFLSSHRAEVVNMLWYEYDEQLHISSEKEISWEEGKEEGRKEGIRILANVCRKLGLSEKEICVKLMEEYGLTEKEAMEFLNPAP